jgi:hypothetical protein
MSLWTNVEHDEPGRSLRPNGRKLAVAGMTSQKQQAEVAHNHRLYAYDAGVKQGY